MIVGTMIVYNGTPVGSFVGWPTGAAVDEEELVGNDETVDDVRVVNKSRPAGADVLVVED